MPSHVSFLPSSKPLTLMSFLLEQSSWIFDYSFNYALLSLISFCTHSTNLLMYLIFRLLDLEWQLNSLQGLWFVQSQFVLISCKRFFSLSLNILLSFFQSCLKLTFHVHHINLISFCFVPQTNQRKFSISASLNYYQWLLK